MATLILDYFGQETGLKLGSRAIIYDLVSDMDTYWTSFIIH